MNWFRGGKTTDGIAGRDLFRRAQDKVNAVAWFEPDGTVIGVNAAFSKLCGYPEDEIAGENVRILLPAGQKQDPQHLSMWNRLVKGASHLGEVHYAKQDGAPLWLNVSIVPVYGAEAAVSALVMTAIDITEAKLLSLDARAKMLALDRYQAVIEFDARGTILTANDNFCRDLGYDLTEIVGQHHSLFIEPSEVDGVNYKQLWVDLAAGRQKSGVFRRKSKSGEDVWLRAIYAPIPGRNGQIERVVKIATDITETQKAIIDAQCKSEAVNRSQAVIEFQPDGTLITANKNFLDAMGYSASEVEGHNHRLFVDADEAASGSYQELWNDLRQGKSRAGQFRRKSKTGDVVWINATYSPVQDPSGRVLKVIKFASVVTEQHVAMESMSRAIHALASGEADIRMGAEAKGAYAALRNTFNRAMEQRETLMKSMVETSQRMLEEATEVSTIANDLAKRAEGQAATLEETAAAMEEISATVDSTADNAKKADQAARSASEEARQGHSVVADTVEAMKWIEEGSRQISSIVETIDAITFQTNLLALNAGVEAARAGEAGRGFAVVASEVRALAQRAAEASKEIEGLITQNNKHVAKGSGFVQATGDVLVKIVAAIDSVVLNVKDISQAAGEQVTSIKEVSGSTSQMYRVTQHTAELAERSAASAGALTDRARRLLELANSMYHTDGPEVASASVGDVRETKRFDAARTLRRA